MNGWPFVEVRLVATVMKSIALVQSGLISVLLEPKGATQEARLSSYCRLLPPREIAKLFSAHGMVGRGGGDRTRPPNYKVPWIDRVATARQIQLLILLTEFKAQDVGCVAAGQRERGVSVEAAPRRIWDVKRFAAIEECFNGTPARGPEKPMHLGSCGNSTKLPTINAFLLTYNKLPKLRTWVRFPSPAP